MDKEILGASFFFKRGEGDRAKAARFVTTIASQLVCRLPFIAEHVRNAIETDRDIADVPMKEQFKKLILQPLERANIPQNHSKTTVVVIDALDECENDDDVKRIINTLSEAKRLTTVSLRFFVTSRPELPIRLGFEEIRGAYTDLLSTRSPSTTSSTISPHS